MQYHISKKVLPSQFGIIGSKSFNVIIIVAESIVKCTQGFYYNNNNAILTMFLLYYITTHCGAIT